MTTRDHLTGLSDSWGWKLVRRPSLIALLLGLVPYVVRAQSDQDWKSCKSDSDTPSHLAISDCTRLIEAKELSQEDRAKAYYNRGAAYWRRGDYDAAIADENEAIEINPKFANAYMRRGAAYAGKGDQDQAITEATKAIELAPENVRAYSNRGGARERKGDFAGAIADATKAIEIDPQFPAGYLVRGDAYAQGGARHFQFPDRRVARAPDRIQRNAGLGLAPMAPHLQPAIAAVEALRDGR